MSGSPALLEHTVELAFGTTPGGDLDAATWTDVSADVHLVTGGDAIDWSSGRQGVRSAPAPGRCSFTLESHDGRYDPRNTDGPYFGDLVLGVPVRIRCHYDGSSWTRFTGFVSNGWPQGIVTDRGVRLVTVEAVDTLGYLLQQPTQESAWAAASAVVFPAPDWHFQTAPNGWQDRLSAKRGRHSSQLVPLDPVVDGGEESWGQLDGDGYGRLPGVQLDATSATVVVGFWIRYPTEPEQLALLDQKNLPILYQPSGSDPGHLRIAAGLGGIKLRAYSDDWYMNVDYSTVGLDGTAQNPLADGRPHFVLCVIRRPNTTGYLATADIADEIESSLGMLATGAMPLVFIDGSLATGYGFATVGSSGWPDSNPAGDLLIGTTRAAPNLDYWASLDAPRYVGTIDHLMLWADHPGTDDDFAELAREATTAGRVAWAGERLDERLARLVTATGLGERLGTLDTSAVVTLQGYRRGEMPELIRRVEDTEQGRIWCDRDGQVRFSSRQWAWRDAHSTTVQVTLTDDPAMQDAGTGFPFLAGGTVIVDDPLRVSNVAQVNSTFGRQQEAFNLASIGKVGVRNPIQLSGLLHPSDHQSKAVAEWLVIAYAGDGTTPVVESVSFHVDPDVDALAELAATIVEGALVRVKVMPPDDANGDPVGDPIVADGHVIGVQGRHGFDGTFVTLHLDPARAGRSWFTWGVSEWGGSDGWAF